MPTKLKVLFLGHEVSDFMAPLARKLREEYSYYIGLFEIRTEKRKEDRIAVSFDANIPPPIESIRINQLLKLIFSSFFYRTIRNYGSLKAAMRHALKYDFYKKAFSEYELFNIHLVNVHSLAYIDFMPARAKIILTFWGSDLLNTRDESKEAVAKAVDRADCIMVHSVEMREILLAKYGRELYDKVKISLLIDDTSRLKEVVDRLPQKKGIIKNFKKKYGIPDERRIVTVGHSGRSLDSHVAIIEAIGKLEEKYKKDVFLVLPMTYSFETKDYIESVERLLKNNGLDALILKDYLSEEELYESRLASEILVRLPKYDAFSLALSESICSDNIIVSASWLPYGRLKRFNIYYHELDYYADITKALQQILNNFSLELERHKGNHQKMFKLFQSEKISFNYNEVFKSLWS